MRYEIKSCEVHSEVSAQLLERSVQMIVLTPLT